MKKSKVWYMGKRLVGDKLQQRFFVDGDPKNVFSFKGLIKGVYTGNAYWANGTGDKLAMPTRPERVDWTEHADYDKWRAQENADSEVARQENVAKRAAKLPELLRDIAAIKKFAKGLRYSERRAFVDWIMGEVEREERERESRELNARLARMSSHFSKKLKLSEKRAEQAEADAAKKKGGK